MINIFQESETETDAAFVERLSMVIDVSSTVAEAEFSIIEPFVFANGSTEAPPPLPPITEDMNLIPTAALSFAYVLMGLVMFVAMFCLAFNYRFRKASIVRMAQPEFLYLLCAGIFVMSSSVIPMSLQEPTPGLD